MKKILIFILLSSFVVHADFNFGECSGSGTFEQSIIHYDGDYENTTTVGVIPSGIQGLKISLVSDKDVDIRLYGENSDKIVHWPHGMLSRSFLETKSYKNVPVTYSGYNGVDGKKGHEFIKITSTTPTVMTMKAFGYQSGYATVNYSWTGKDGCTQATNGSGSFSQTLTKNSTTLVGTIPPNIENVNISLIADTDLDIQLYALDGTAIVSWKPTGLLSGSSKESLIYHDMNITWSGYNGTGGQAGHEFIKITGLTSEMLVMKVYGYQAGNAEVSYSWGDIVSPTVSNIHPIDITQNSAKVVWDVSTYATGQVEYGKTSAYGYFNTKETSLNYNHHEQRLQNLNPGTTYHYRVISEDTNGQEVISGDNTFKTMGTSYATLGTYTPLRYPEVGLENKAVVYYPEGGITTDMPVVLFVKGGGSVVIDDYSGIMKFMASKGYYVIGVDADSYRSTYVKGFFEIALDRAKNVYGLDISKLAVMGHSLGGGQTFYIMKYFRDMGYGNTANLILSLDGWFSFDMNQVDINQLDSKVSFIQMNGIDGTGTDPRIHLKIWNLATSSQDKSFYTLAANSHSYVVGDLENVLQKEDLLLLIAALTDDTFSSSNDGKNTIPVNNKASYDSIYDALKPKDTYNSGDCAGVQYNAISVLENFDIDYCVLGNVLKKYPETIVLDARATDDTVLKPTLNNPTIDPVYQTKITMVDKSDTSTSSYSKVQSWNSDMTHLRIGNRLYDAHTLTEIDITKNKTQSEAYHTLCSRSSDYFRWSSKVPNRFFVLNSSKQFVQAEIMGNDINCSTILEPFLEYEVVHLGPHEGNIDVDDKYVVFIAKKPDDTTLYVILYDIENKVKVWTKTMPSQAWEWVTINGSSFWKPSTLDWISISPSGKYIVFNNDNGYTDGMYSYDINLSNKTKLQYKWDGDGNLYSEGGHGDMGYDTDGHEVWVQFISGLGIYSFNLDNPTELGKELLGSPYGGGHISCRNTKRPGWCYITTVGTNYKRIFALKLDGTGEENVQNYTQSHIDNNFHETYGSTSPDGTKMIFNSHWGTNKVETFVVEAE